MKTKFKNLTTLDKVIYSFYGIALILFISSALPTLGSFNCDSVLTYSIRFTPYLVLGVTAFFSNKYNVRRLVSLNMIYLALCFFISEITDFNVMLINLNTFLDMDNITYYSIIVLVTLIVIGATSQCSNKWTYAYSLSMSIISIARATEFSLMFDKIFIGVWLMAFSIVAYFFTIIAVSERFSEDNKYTNLSNKVFGYIYDELDKKTDENKIHIHETFKKMIAESISDENENLSRYCDFYEFIKKRDFISIEEKGYLNKDFIIEFCSFVSAYLDEETTTEQEIVFNNIAKILANENIDENTYKRELINLYYLISEGVVVDPIICADKIDISHESDNKTAVTLSNFAKHPFEIDCVQIKCLESFLQALKFKSKNNQIKICQMDGKKAMRKGKHHNFWKWNGGNLYWQGKKINRFSDEYHHLLSKAYATMFDSNEDFKNALLSTVDVIGVQKLFEYSVGKDNPQDTILTVEEFTDRLYGTRKYLINEEENKYD